MTADAKVLISKYAGNGIPVIRKGKWVQAEQFAHGQQIGVLDTPEGYRRAEVHWSQHSKYGEHDFFVKEWLE